MGPDVVQVTLPGNRPPWTATGLHVDAGDTVTLLGSGFIRWSRTRDMGAGPKVHLWGRVPGGEAFNCTQDTATVTIDRAGELELCIYKGAWADRYGNLASGPRPYESNTGALEVTVLRWPRGVDPVDGLQRLGDTLGNRPLVEAELHRLRHPVVQPAGWTHFADLGPSDIFRQATVEGRPAIDVVCDHDAGILQKPARIALDPTTTISWTWRVDALPSEEAEDTRWTHDYLSIATEFDSGRDLTWFWSCCMGTVDTTFDCPMPGWRRRETHMPLRSGADELGRFHRERRNVWEDHCRFMGEPPGEIVAVWLIAASTFSRRTGRATFTDISLTTGDQTVPVL
jgi:hypothetical protein